MPQMSPLSWLLLMMIFVMILIMFNLINYYNFNYTLSEKNYFSKKKTLINWMW